jgi:hypothetical protein
MKLVILLSFVTASISFTVSETKLFKGFRDWIEGKNDFLFYLFNCGYCLGHWIAFGLVALFKPKLFNSWWLLDYFLTAIVIAWLGGLQWALMSLMRHYTENKR